MSQSIRQSEDEEETDLNPVQQAVKDAQQTNTNKKKDDQTDDTPTEDTNTQPEQPAQGGHQEKSQGRAAAGGRTQGLHLDPLRYGGGQGHESGLAVGGHRPVERHDSGENGGIGRGDTVFDVLCRIRDTYKKSPTAAPTAHVDGINNLYEFDGGRGRLLIRAGIPKRNDSCCEKSRCCHSCGGSASKLHGQRGLTSGLCWHKGRKN